MDNPTPSAPVLVAGAVGDRQGLCDRFERGVIVESLVSDAVDRVRHDEVACLVGTDGLRDGCALDLVKRVRDESVELPIILWTAEGDEELASAAISAGVSDYLIRDRGAPEADRERLRDRVEEVVGRERKFRAVFEESFDAMFLTDDEGAVVDANPVACDLLGLTREELRGRSVDEFTPPDVELEDRLGGGGAADRDRGTLPLVRPDGKKRVVEFSATPEFLPGRHLTVLRDVTEERRMEQELDEFFERVTHAVHGLDEKWCFTYLNERAEELLGRSEEELRGKYVWDEFPDALERTYRERYERAMETQEPVVFEEFSDAADRWLEVHVYPSETGLSVSFQDISDRKQRERQLEQYETVVEAVDDGIYAVDEDGTFAMVNEAFCELTGYDRADLIGRHATTVHDEELPMRASRLADGTVAGGSKGIIELDIHTNEGERIPCECRLEPFPIDEGHGWCGVIRDISDRRDRERQLELFRDLVDHSLDGLNVIDPATAAVIDTNQASCRMLGYTREEMLSLTVPDINPEFSMDMWQEFVESVETEGELVIETTHQRKDGSTFPVEVKISRVSFDSSYHVAAVRDISERKAREEELEAETEKYRTLIETAPDPIFVADVETGEIVEANSAACRIRRQSREELVGLHQSDLHPDDDWYQSLFESHVEDGGTRSHFDDEQVHLQTADGERIPVSISAETVDLDDRRLIHGIFRDVSEVERYRDSMETLNHATRSFFDSETDHEVAERTIDTAGEVLDEPIATVYLYDEVDGLLRPASYTQSHDRILGKPPTLGPGSSIAWRVYATKRKAVLDDVRTDEDVFNPGTPIRSEFLFPLGEHGVFILADTEAGGFDTLTIDLLEILGGTARAALDQVDRAQQLQERRRESSRRAQRLDRANQMNRQTRSIIETVVQADSRQEIQAAVCDHLASLDRVAFAWMGEPDYASEEISPAAWAGSSQEYLSDDRFEFEGGSPPPAVTAIRDGETVHVENIADSVQEEPWRRVALLYDLRSVVSIPLQHDNLLFGALTIYGNEPGAFDDQSLRILEDLGGLVGYTLDSGTRPTQVNPSKYIDLTFECSSISDPFLQLATELDARLEVKNVSSRADGAWLLQVLAHDAPPGKIRDLAEDLVIVEDARTVGEPDPVLVEFIASDSCFVSTAVEFGVESGSIELNGSQDRVTVSLSQDRDVRSFIRRVRDRYPGLSLVGRQTVDTEYPVTASYLLQQLTPRQREILKTAYFAGFFEQPRKRTGGEVADMLDLSQPAFSKQVRNCQQQLLQPLYDPE